MWNKQRRDEEPVRPYTPPPPSVPPPTPSFAAPKKEATPMSTTPTARADDRGNSATIGKAVKIIGQIHSKEDLYIDGDVEGTVEAPDHRLTVGPNGTVRATIKAREVVALGLI